MIRPNAFRASSVIVILLAFFTVHAYADLVIHSGETLTLNSSNSEILFIAGDLIIEDGATLEGASNTEIRISGSWDNSLGGSFIHAGAKVFFTNTAVSVIKGNNNFCNIKSGIVLLLIIYVTSVILVDTKEKVTSVI